MDHYHSTVYVWGSHAHGALGCPTTSRKVELVPKRLASCCINGYSHPAGPHQTLANAINAVAGNGITTVITDKWEAFSWGKEIGIHNTSYLNGLCSACRSIRKIQLANVAEISHGNNHSCATTVEGHVYGWGDDSHGNIAGSSLKNKNSNYAISRKNHIFGGGAAGTRKKLVKKPRRIEIEGEDLRNINNDKYLPMRQKNGCDCQTKKVVCGERHTCILHDGTLHMMGANDAGQLGIGSSRNHAGVHRVASLNNFAFVEISCGANHCAAISKEDKAVFTWGCKYHACERFFSFF